MVNITQDYDELLSEIACKQMEFDRQARRFSSLCEDISRLEVAAQTDPSAARALQNVQALTADLERARQAIVRATEVIRKLEPPGSETPVDACARRPQTVACRA